MSCQDLKKFYPSCAKSPCITSQGPGIHHVFFRTHLILRVLYFQALMNVSGYCMVSGPLDNCLEAYVLWFGTFSISLEFIGDVIVAQGKSVSILRAGVYHGQHLMLIVHRKTFQSIKGSK